MPLNQGPIAQHSGSSWQPVKQRLTRVNHLLVGLQHAEIHRVFSELHALQLSFQTGDFPDQLLLQAHGVIQGYTNRLLALATGHSTTPNIAFIARTTSAFLQHSASEPQVVVFLLLYSSFSRLSQS